MNAKKKDKYTLLFYGEKFKRHKQSRESSIIKERNAKTGQRNTFEMIIG